MATTSVSVSAVAGSANVAMYWGQGPSQVGLQHYCDQSTVDIIPIGFINRFPNQANGLVAENFGNQCWNGNYTGPGYDNVVNPADDFLYKQCPQLSEDLYYCQTKTNKKMVLSIGGGVAGYELNNWDDGVALAEFLWGAYGPYTEEWVASGGVRPLDLGYYNNDTSKRIDIDGFDFDIEYLGPDLQQGYIGCITTLRQKFLLNPSKTYLITGAPQCPLPENNMGLAIAQVKFDALFIQFYNNDAYGCSARNWTNKNTNYASTKVEKASGFNYNAWVSVLATGASKHAKLFIGLPGGVLSTGQAAATVGDILTVAETTNLISAYSGATNFGGVMIWEATYAEANKNAVGLTYYQSVKKALLAAAPPVSSSSTSTVSSTVYPTTKSSTSSTVSSTKKSSTISSTSTSSTVSSTKKSSTISSTSTSSTASPTPKTSTVPSTSATSSASSSSTISSTTTSSTSAATPTTVPSVGQCTYIGCYTEATGIRALSGASYAGSVDFAQMTVEYCASKCTGFTYFGLEYSGECYCGNEFNAGSVKTDAALCTNPDYKCNGAPGEFCGGYGVLDAYQCGSSASSSSSAVSTTSSPTSSSAASSSTVSSSTVSSSSVSSSSVPSSSTSSSATVTSTSQTSTSTSVSTTSSEASSSISSTGSITSSHPSSLSSISYSSTTGIFTNSTTTSTAPSTSTTPSTTASVSSSLIYSSLGPYTNTSSTHGTSSSTKSYPVSVTTSSSGVSTTKMTTSTVYTTSVYTVTSCAATVTDCPGRIGQVTTETISLYTTICPVTEAQGTATATPTAAPYSEIPGYTVSTVYTTTVYTITSCAATVTDCPARIGSVTTDIISLYTTYCPVSGSSPASTEVPAYPINYPSYPAGSGETSTSTTSSTFTTYRTVTVSLSTATVVPVVYSTATVVPVKSSVAPYPTGSATSANAGTTGTGTGSPVISATPLVTYVGSGAGKNVASSLAVALGALVLLL